MARLKQDSPNPAYDSEYEPERRGDRTAGSAVALANTKPRTSPRKKPQKSYCTTNEPIDDYADVSERLVPKSTPKQSRTGRQVTLRPLKAPSLFKPLPPPLTLRDESLPRQRKPPRYSTVRKPLGEIRKPPGQGVVAAFEPSEGESDLEESIWCGSATEDDESEDELPSPRKFLPAKAEAGQRPVVNKLPVFDIAQPRLRKPLCIPDSDSESRFRDKAPNAIRSTNVPSRPGSSSDKENTGAFLRFSPPRLYGLPDKSKTARPTTPPQSPSKSRLQSPSKTRTRIPTPPLRQSLDAFWDPDTVNEWNEQYSPKKILKSPRKLNFLHEDSSQSPLSSPRKPGSPSKRNKAELEVKKSFESRKHDLAQAFLLELDTRITDNKLSELSASTGGIKLLWSRTLNTTAGRANWRKETTKTRLLDGAIQTTYKHHASIELAEKVIDDEHRLLNVLAHEFCHLANFMISGIKDQPHGRQFKVWGKSVSEAFGDRGVEVTTKHEYKIEWKYVWRCENLEECGAEFGRHSRSIDPARKVCGKCKGRLVQVKPVPRKDGEMATGYAAFVKENFASVKAGLPLGATQKEVMEAVAKKYRADKEKLAPTSTVTEGELDTLTKALDVVVLDD